MTSALSTAHFPPPAAAVAAAPFLFPPAGPFALVRVSAMNVFIESHDASYTGFSTTLAGSPIVALGIFRSFALFPPALSSRGPLLTLLGVAGGVGVAAALRSPDLRKRLANSPRLVWRWGDRLYLLVLDGARWTLVPVSSICSRGFRIGFVSLAFVKDTLSHVRLPVRAIAASARCIFVIPAMAARNAGLGIAHWWNDWLDSWRRAPEAPVERTDAAPLAPPAPPEPEPEFESFRIGDMIAARERAAMPDLVASTERVRITQHEPERPEANEELFEEAKIAGRDMPLPPPQSPPSPPPPAPDVEEPLATEERAIPRERELPNRAFDSTDARSSALVSETLDGLEMPSADAAATDDPRERAEVLFAMQRFRLDSNGQLGEPLDAESASTEDLVDSRRKSALHSESLPEKGPEAASVRPLVSSEEQLRISHEPEPTAVERGERSIAEAHKPLGDSPDAAAAFGARGLTNGARTYVERGESAIFKQQVAQLGALFDECDLDASGELCLEEIRIVLKEKGYSDHFVERFYCHLDLNKDGKITREEFIQALTFLPQDIFLRDTALSDDELLAIFDEADTDHSGSLSWSEFKLSLLSRGLGREFIESYFGLLDLDGSAEISREEYAKCLGLAVQ